MKLERKLIPLDSMSAKIRELDGKRKAEETEKEWRERIEAKLNLLLSRCKK